MPSVAVNPANPVLSAVAAALPVAAPPVSIFVQHQATPPAAAAVVAPYMATNALGSLNDFEEFLLVPVAAPPVSIVV